MDVLILGGAGELGANFAKLCTDLGHSVHIVDIIRFYEAWRLKELGIQDKVDYIWKSSFDLDLNDCVSADLILDCACIADRPLGTSSPIYTVTQNLQGPVHVLETLARMRREGRKTLDYFRGKYTSGTYTSEKCPLIIYPSSSVEFLGVPQEEQPITELSIPKPTNVYGYTKWAAEELYKTYNRAFDIPCAIIRTGSCYGPMMRTDQFIAQCIIKCLQGKDVVVKSPEATRTYTFTKDVMEFYRLFLNKFEHDPEMFNGILIYNGGNAEDIPYPTIAAADLIRKIIGGQETTIKIIPSDYEVGELVNGKPVYQWEKSVVAKDLLGWEPQYSFPDGLHETIDWFRGKYT